ncbi:hypothetical protein FZC83_02025 [Rossellomorea marisflavi]|uniref:Uncharacterized protein n=1 Tax=Rossellomorea marisflavi TaxID=189381 RepID=A0A5D4RYA4_9BACI|nr:hypothetical protein [Rossellomorea marisflavi]TYS56373.1 hypothetical protein FZC83_02025 [Rossellomorea marisflavi]
MNQISKEALEFLDEAIKGFNLNSNLTTYRSEDESFIALRCGFREDCIAIYELGSPVGNFTQQLVGQHKVLVDYEEVDKVRKMKEMILMQTDKVSKMINSNIDEEQKYNVGYLKALEEVLKLVTEVNFN